MIVSLTFAGSFEGSNVWFQDVKTCEFDFFTLENVTDAKSGKVSRNIHKKVTVIFIENVPSVVSFS